MKKVLITALAFGASALTAVSQNGDKGDPNKQKDPIPADKIPAAPFLNAQQAIKTLQVAEGFTFENIAEDVHQPVSLSFDANGRAWVVEMTNYMIDLDGSKENEPRGRIKVLEDTDGDGSLDKSVVFLDKLILPRACAVTSDGLLYAHKDQLFFIKRGGKKGLKPIGEPELIDKDYAVGGNAEHKSNGLLYGRDNWYYNAKSSYRYRKINGEWVKQKTAFRGQWGIAQDDAGRLYYNNNSTLLVGDSMRPNLLRNHPHYTPKHSIANKVGSNRVYPIRVNPGVNRAYTGKVLGKDGKLINCTGASGMTIYRGENFPKEFYGSSFTTEPCGNLISAKKIKYDSVNTPKGSRIIGNKPFMASTDEWFRPVNIYTAPDGTLWVIDMYMGLVQHKTYMTTYLRKQYQSRGLDKPKPNNGRIYRVRYTKNVVGNAPKMGKASIKKLKRFLSHPNGTVRDNAQRLLVEKITSSKGAAAQWKSACKGEFSGLGLMHALWVCEAMQVVPARLITAGLASQNTDVVNSALELAHLADSSVLDALLTYSPTSRTTHSYLFALGKQATAKSHKKAVEVIAKAKQKRIPLVAAIYTSGLGLNAAEMLKLDTKIDEDLKRHLKKASKKKASETAKAPVVPKQHKASYEKGKALYLGIGACSGCHGLEGQGQGEVFPPLAPSEWVANTDTFAKVIIHGLEGPISVAGKKYAGASAMPKRPDLTDSQVADIITYVRYMKGNKGGAVTAKQIKKIRKATKARTKSYTDKELRADMK